MPLLPEQVREHIDIVRQGMAEAAKYKLPLAMKLLYPDAERRGAVLKAALENLLNDAEERLNSQN